MTPYSRPVTDEDVHITEALIAHSFSNLKKSLSKKPIDLTKPVTDTIKEHPLATVGVAAGAGLLAYELIRLVTPRVVVKEIAVQPQVEVREQRRKDLTSQLVSLAMPYLAGILQQELGRIISGSRRQ